MPFKISVTCWAFLYRLVAVFDANPITRRWAVRNQAAICRHLPMPLILLSLTLERLD